MACGGCICAHVAGASGRADGGTGLTASAESVRGAARLQDAKSVLAGCNSSVDVELACFSADYI